MDVREDLSSGWRIELLACLAEVLEIWNSATLNDHLNQFSRKWLHDFYSWGPSTWGDRGRDSGQGWRARLALLAGVMKCPNLVERTNLRCRINWRKSLKKLERSAGFFLLLRKFVLSIAIVIAMAKVIRNRYIRYSVRAGGRPLSRRHTRFGAGNTCTAKPSHYQKLFKV